MVNSVVRISILSSIGQAEFSLVLTSHAFVSRKRNVTTDVVRVNKLFSLLENVSNLSNEFYAKR